MNDSLHPLPWQHEQWQQMTQMASKKQMPHAWLFVGPQGVGKRHFMRALTALLLCEKRETYACGQCRSCQQFVAGHHPNAHYLQREIDEKTGKQKRDITIEQVRDMNERLALSSHYGQAKLALIDPADALNQSSVNALLKTIEEPPANSYVLLVSERLLALAPTLRSRCQQLRFAVPPHTESIKWLGSDINADFALHQSLGAPIKARQLMDSGLLERRREWVTELTRISMQKADPMQLAGTLTASKVSAKEDAADFLRWFLTWLTAEMRLTAKSNGTYRPVALDAMMRETLESQRRLAGNGMPQLILESLLVNWWHLTRKSKTVQMSS